MHLSHAMVRHVYAKRIEIYDVRYPNLYNGKVYSTHLFLSNKKQHLNIYILLLLQVVGSLRNKQYKLIEKVAA